MALAEGAALLFVGLGALAAGAPRAGADRARRGPARADGPERAAAGRAGAGRDAYALRLVADGERSMSVAIGAGPTFAGYRVESLVGPCVTRGAGGNGRPRLRAMPL